MLVACIIPEGFAQLCNTTLQGTGFNDSIGPDGIEQCFVANNLSLVPGKIMQNLDDLGLQ